jgi:hypothetical protein
VFTCLKAPDRQEGLATSHDTTEKHLDTHTMYLYDYLTAPLHAGRDELYAISAFIGSPDAKDTTSTRSEWQAATRRRTVLTDERTACQQNENTH